ncbi:E3 SUMO-protein ligase ZBED1-like [Lycorma delicatula]|uniref:E3 SUMO-protein ligase ZBED1-like n=1 Tax=Lycorma delicatula TaxID=130591 RepID=UPI003F51198D
MIEFLERLVRNYHIEACAITTDSWTSVSNNNYMAITIHSIDHDCNLKTQLLTCMEIYSQHTAENIAIELQGKFNEWAITDKIGAVVSDHAANLKAAIRNCQLRHIPCLAYTINLIVQAAVSEVKTTVVKAKAIVEFFQRSSHAASKLQNMQRQMNFKELKLKQEVPTRWNSLLHMFNRLLETKEPLISTIALMNPILNNISFDEWTVIAEMCKLLKMFEEITIEISSQKTVTIS